MRKLEKNDGKTVGKKRVTFRQILGEFGFLLQTTVPHSRPDFRHGSDWPWLILMFILKLFGHNHKDFQTNKRQPEKK